jgi:ABC-type branched-subunit amino acid transport system substrate-binding protein
MSYGLVKEAHDLARAKGGGEVSPAMLEGFAAGKVLVEALRRAGPRPSRARIQSALENFGKFDIGGLEVHFSPQDHTGMDFADLSIITADGKFRR